MSICIFHVPSDISGAVIGAPAYIHVCSHVYRHVRIDSVRACTCGEIPRAPETAVAVITIL